MFREEDKAFARKVIEEADISYSWGRPKVRKVLENLSDLVGQEYNDYEISRGASKLCLIFKKLPFVIKWSYEEDFDPSYEEKSEEAFAEVDVYQDAVKEGLGFFFPETELLIEHNGIAFVIQQKINYSTMEVPFQKIKKYRKMVKTSINSKSILRMQKDFDKATENVGYQRDLDTTWAAMALSIYGKKRCKALSQFIIAHEINDLHEANIGYLNDKPILLDFSGYCR